MDPARIPPAQLRRDRSGTGRPFSSKALRECYAEAADRFGWRAARSRRGRCATPPAASSAGAWARALFPAPMFQAAARATLRADGTALVETSAPTWARARGRRWRRSAPTGSGSPAERIEFAPATPTFPMPASPAARAIPRPRAARSRRRQRRHRHASRRSPPPIPTRRSSAPATPGSRPATAASTIAAIRAAAKATPTSSPAPASREIEGTGRGARDPADAAARAMFSHGAVFAEVTVDPDLGQVRVTPPRRRLRRRADHQSAPRAEPATPAA